jgi:two-component system CitB family sensor kinase
VKIFEEYDKMQIVITDNGPGIPEDMRNSIYNMGSTSKAGERGFGMYIVKKIIDEAKGTINFEVNNGTKWDISIPMERS